MSDPAMRNAIADQLILLSQAIPSDVDDLGQAFVIAGLGMLAYRHGIEAAREWTAEYLDRLEDAIEARVGPDEGSALH